MSNYQLYQEVLTSAAQGTPLWEPVSSPGHVPPSIGDVGYLRFGAFIRLFNATLPPGHEDNENGEPENYIPLKIHSSVRRAVLQRGVIAASGVQLTSFDNDEPNAHVHFKCTAKAGAVVMADSDVHRQDIDAPSLETFAAYITTHSHQWAKFARFKLMHEVALHELILLTGCDLTSGRYSVTVFNSARISRIRRHEASFQLSHPTSKCHTWAHSPAVGYFQHNYGPWHHGTRPSKHCLFVRGVRLLNQRVEKLEREDEGESWFVDNCYSVQPRGPLDAILRYLTDSSSNAEFAVAHDSDLARLIDKSRTVCDYRSVLKQLQKSRRSVVVHSGVARLA